MKSLLVYYDPELTTTLEEIDIPQAPLRPLSNAPLTSHRTYGDDEVLIKVVVAGCNPKDWKHPMPDYFNSKLNQGDDCAGTVEAVGSAVRRFRSGDRVAGFHRMGTPRGTYAEFAVCPQHTVMHIPATMSYEEAATAPLAGA
jgi:NADPH2:quinone reductase